MTVTTIDLISALDELDWKYELDDNEIIYTGVVLEREDHVLQLVIHTQQEGKILMVLAPFVIDLTGLTASNRLLLSDRINQALSSSLIVKCWVHTDYHNSDYLRVSANTTIEEGMWRSSTLINRLLWITEFVKNNLGGFLKVIKTHQLITVPDMEEIIIMTRGDLIELVRREADDERERNGDSLGDR